MLNRLVIGLGRITQPVGLMRSLARYKPKRGRLGGLKNGVANWDKREQAKEFRATGMTLQAIADRLEVAKGTISKWLKK